MDEGVQTFFGSTGRTRAESDAAYAEMQPLEFPPSAERWRTLPRTLTTLCCRGTLRVAMLGDSIINDTSRSRWEDYLSEATGATIAKITSVRGSTGSLFYAEGVRTYCAALRYHPDLVILGGISEIDIASLRTIIETVQSETTAEVLLMTPVFGMTDPAVPSQWSADIGASSEAVRLALRKLAEETGIGFLDARAQWGSYVLASGQDVSWYKRDSIHANARGEQILGRLLTNHLNPYANGDDCVAGALGP